MYRGSAAGVLVERGFCSNPPQKSQKGDYIHLVNLLGDSACRSFPPRTVLQQGYGRSSAQDHGLGGDARLQSREHTRYCSYCCRGTENGGLARTAKI